MDRVATWPESASVPDKSSFVVAQSFDNEWLYCYPAPAKVIYDNGTKLIGNELQELHASYVIKAVPIIVKNPQLNA